MMQQQGGGLLSLPGFNFTPTDEEILDYYLRTRIYGNTSVTQISSVIKEFDVYSTEPWNLPRDFFGYRNEESDIYFFTPRHPRSKNSKRANRAAGEGFWDGNAKGVVIEIGSEIVGFKTALNFKLITKGGKIKTDWIMHEYRLLKYESTSTQDTTFDEVVLCKIHRKKSTKDTIKRFSEEAQRMAKKSRVEEDQPLPVTVRFVNEVCDESLQTSSMLQPQVNSLERGADSSMPNVPMSETIPMPELPLQPGFQVNFDDFFLSEDELFLDEFPVANTAIFY